MYDNIVLPSGYTYYTPEDYTLDGLSHIPIDHLISPVRTYGILRVETQYLDHTVAKAALKEKLKDLDAWNNNHLEIRKSCPPMHLDNGAITGVRDFERNLDDVKCIE